MRKRIFSIHILLLATLIISACTSRVSAPSVSGETTPIRTLSVTGVGKVSLSPDMASISIGVSTQNSSAKEALASNNQQTQKVIETLVVFGIDSKDIRTTDFSIYPQQEWGANGQLIGVFYHVNNTVLVTVRELEQLGRILDTVVQAGANNIYGIQFDLTDKSAALAEARSLAVQDAQTEAEQLAEAAGITLGLVQSISTYAGEEAVPLYRGMVMVEAPAEVPISAGEMTISVQVDVVYEIH
ncbi:MAG: SIMPL domain-containing protein [Chloroflexota bacterium]